MPGVFRTDQVGSLIRPQSLLDARTAFHEGRIGQDELRQAEDEAILQALDLQRSTGIAVFTDGEMRRDAFMTGLSENVEGFVDEYPMNEVRRPDGTTVMVEGHGKAVQGKLRPKDRLAKHEADFLRRNAGGRFKITMISPIYAANTGFRAGVTDTAYGTREELLQDVVKIISDEMAALVSEGVPYLQMDEGLARFVREGWREQAASLGQDPDQEIADAITGENQCWDSITDPGITKAVHICRGNRTAWGGATGTYDSIAERAFSDLHVDRFLLEYDTDRAGDFQPLRFVPQGKTVVLGLASTKTPQLERQDDLLRRIEEAAKYCPLDRLALGPQCGFQSAANPDGAFMTMDDEKRKLELIVDTAQQVWGSS